VRTEAPTDVPVSGAPGSRIHGGSDDGRTHLLNCVTCRGGALFVVLGFVLPGLYSWASSRGQTHRHGLGMGTGSARSGCVDVPNS